MTEDRFAGQVAVVTGGSSGIGAACAERLAADGAEVMVVDLHQPGHPCDIGSEVEVATYVARLAQRHGHVDVLVNCAAITDPRHQRRDGDVATMDLDVWQRTLRVDLTGTMLMCRALLPLLEGGGAIVNVTSNAASAGDPSLAAYAAAKAGVDQLTRSIATSHGRRGVRCNAVSPANIASPSFRQNVPAGTVAMLERQCLLPHLGRVEDVAAAVLFLASSQSSFLTGITLRVDGGVLAHLPTAVL